MPKFRKRAVVEAVQYPGRILETSAREQFEEWLKLRTSSLELGPPRYKDEALVLPSLGGGEILVMPGEWIIQGVFGEMYPCIDVVFRETYEELPDA